MLELLGDLGDSFLGLLALGVLGGNLDSSGLVLLDGLLNLLS